MAGHRVAIWTVGDDIAQHADHIVNYVKERSGEDRVAFSPEAKRSPCLWLQTGDGVEAIDVGEHLALNLKTGKTAWGSTRSSAFREVIER